MEKSPALQRAEAKLATLKANTQQQKEYIKLLKEKQKANRASKKKVSKAPTKKKSTKKASKKTANLSK